MNRGLRVESLPHAIEKALGIMIDRVDKSVKDDAVVGSPELAYVHLLEITNHILENAPTDTRVGWQPFQRRPSQRLLVLSFLPKRRRPREYVLRGVPHCIQISKTTTKTLTKEGYIYIHKSSSG